MNFSLIGDAVTLLLWVAGFLAAGFLIVSGLLLYNIWGSL
jgi:hypothetical protein